MPTDSEVVSRNSRTRRHCGPLPAPGPRPSLARNGMMVGSSPAYGQIFTRRVLGSTVKAPPCKRRLQRHLCKGAQRRRRHFGHCKKPICHLLLLAGALLLRSVLTCQPPFSHPSQPPPPKLRIVATRFEKFDCGISPTAAGQQLATTSSPSPIVSSASSTQACHPSEPFLRLSSANSVCRVPHVDCARWRELVRPYPSPPSHSYCALLTVALLVSASRGH